jgi:hypothetical protein
VDAGEQQQQTVQTRFRQQERSPFRKEPDAVDAVASPASEIIPTVAASAIKVSRTC